MGLVAELFIWLIVESFFAFIFYSTGCLILKLCTLGKFKAEFKDFASFRASKSKKANSVWLLGVSFYIALFALMVWLSQ